MNIRIIYNFKSFILSHHNRKINISCNLIRKILVEQQHQIQQQQKLLIHSIALFKSDNQIHTKFLRANMSMLEKPKVVFVLGGPGAGKGTQCQKIVNKFGFVHLSAGDLLREERSREDSKYGQLIENYIKEGKIVPVEITCSLLENAMNKNMQEQGRNKFLIDGFPRNQDNLDGWQNKMSDKVNLLFILFFDCPENVCIERCLNRGQAGSGRSDDNLESLKKRINTYQNDSLPIIEYYKKLNLVRHIDASPNADDVFTKVEAAFNEILIGSGDTGNN